LRAGKTTFDANAPPQAQNSFELVAPYLVFLNPIFPFHGLFFPQRVLGFNPCQKILIGLDGLFENLVTAMILLLISSDFCSRFVDKLLALFYGISL
jgi:hypothetical protein